jgi:hypothetical protein
MSDREPVHGPRNAIQKAKFSQSEDLRLAELVERHGDKDWPTIANQMPNRSVRQCRERWTNYLTPSVTNGPWSPQEDDLLLARFKEFGARWRKLTEFFVGRTDINIKNHYIVLTRARSVHARRQSPPERSEDDKADEPSSSIPSQQPPSLAGGLILAPPPLELGGATDRPADWFSRIWSSHDADQKAFTFDFFM